MNSKTRKWIWISVVLIVLSAITFWFIKPGSVKTATDSFETAEVKRGDLENLVDSTGTLSAVETVEVGSQVSGIVETLLVDHNTVVKKGQVLAELDKTPFEIAVRDAQASLMRSKARLEQARSEHQRNQTLFEQEHISETEYLATKTTYLSSQADAGQAESVLSKARLNLSYTVIRSPIDGTIIERTVNQGQTIAASFQAPKLFVIAQDLTRMQIEAAVDESDIGLIKEGQKTRFTVQSYPDDAFTGTVRQIRLQPKTVQNVVNYTVVIDAANDLGRLLPGMTATIDFLVEEKHDVLLVPNSALSYTPSDSQQKQLKAGLEEGGKPVSAEPGSGMMGMNHKAEDLGRVYYLDADQTLAMAFFRKGATDGMMTEVLGSPGIKEGMAVIIGKAGNPGKNSRTQQKGIFPPPPGGGPHG
jgi:HlyD family secretion protein